GKPIRESERERRANFAADLTRMDANIVTCGDMPADPEAVKKALAEPPAETRDQLLARLGFPARPRSWPIMMRWPADRDRELLSDPAVSAEQRQAYIRGLQERQRV
ncbi:hypothetical protein MMY85_19275, partial [Acinetobacter baumannii]|nr:hypothetical protein [Acinetobacter baumannii]